jgi:CelD/BcsL family acetyltransferase involved in cellulose biosynthesis
MNDLSPNRRTQARLRVKTIDTFAEFEAVEAAWKALEDRDPEMTFFLSWDWLAQAFRDNPYRWSVLVVHADDNEARILGLLPLKYNVHWSTSRRELQTEIEAGGRLLFSEYTGFLCDPDNEAVVMEALAGALHAQPWAKFSLRYVAQQRRAEMFCAYFDALGYSVTWKDYRINNGETDNLICPHVTLPDDFETYLQSSVSANTRQRYRRFKRKFFATGEYRFTHSDDDSFDADVATLMKFWTHKWSQTKGLSQAKKVARSFEKVLEAALKTEALFLPVLWRGDTPLAALGHVMDPRAGSMHFIIAGRDSTADEAFIGAALHFHSIECAILLGCEEYDFGHGDEEYKFSYGADKTKVQYFSIRRRDADRAKVFDSISTGLALKRIESLIASGEAEHAKRACRQLSQVFE